jgi:hypothetical protein
MGGGWSRSVVEGKGLGRFTRTFLLAALAGAPGCGDDATAPAVPTTLEVDGVESSATVGSQVPVRVRVLGRSGEPLAGIEVSFEVLDGGGSVSESGSMTGEDGWAFAFWTLGTVKGMQRLRIVAGELARTLEVTGTGGGLDDLRLTGKLQEEGPVGWPLDDPIEFLAVDRFGDPVAGVVVSWIVESGGGRLQDVREETDAEGLVSARWILGPQPGPQKLQVEASQDGVTYGLSFAVEAFAGIRVRDSIPIARIDRPMSEGFEAWGGDAPFTWSVVEGALPAGLTLDPDGALYGTPAEDGTFSLAIQVTDSRGETGRVGGAMVVCGAALSLTVGESTRAGFPDPCGVLLPDEPGHVYRIGVMARGSDEDYVIFETGLSVRTRRLDESAIGAVRSHSERVSSFIGPQPSLLGPVAGVVTGVRDMVGGGYPTPDGRRFRAARGARSAGSPDQASELPERRTFHVQDLSTRTRTEVEARLRMSSKHLAYYEDVGNADHGGTTYDDTSLSAQMDYFERYGWPVIEEVFGGLGPDVAVTAFADGAGAARNVPARDVDENGRILLLQLRPSFMGPTRAYTAPCDRMPSPSHAADPQFACDGSNEAELVYTRSGNAYTWMHEIRHVASAGWRLWDGRPVQATVVEEGTAVMASELMGRRAASVAPGHRVIAGEVYLDGPEPTWSTYFLWAAPTMAHAWLAAAPASGLVAEPSPNPTGVTVYYSGWFFHRYLIDRFAAGRPAPLLFDLTAGGAGPAHVGNTVGVPWHDLLADFMAAILVDDVTEAREATDNRFVSYDFAGIVALDEQSEYADTNPWPALQGSETYGTHRWDLATWHTSPNLFQLTADGAGELLVEVLDDAGGPTDEADATVAVVVRVR